MGTHNGYTLKKNKAILVVMVFVHSDAGACQRVGL